MFKAVFAALILSSPVLADPLSARHVMDWMEGCWTGEGFGGEVVECWMTSPDGRMTGSFQLVNNGELGMAEIFMLADFPDGPAIRLRHYNPDMSAWEAEGEYTNFPLLDAGEDFTRFEGVTFRRTGEDTARVEVMIESVGEVRTEILNLTRR